MKENILLAIVDFHRSGDWSLEDVTLEMTELVRASFGEVVGHIICPASKPTASYLIGKGKAEEIALFCAQNQVHTVIFSCDLKGSQIRNLEEMFKAKTIDRTQLILDIFARRAKSMEGKMQVELAQLEYLLPRLVGKGSELSRLGGGIGTLGPGETKLETDRRRISDRISKLKLALQEISQKHQLKRKKRKDQQTANISLVGYTNAGKSTLLNRLTDAEQKTQNALFTTLDSLSRQFVLPSRQKIVISDTVGFIHDLPHHLIESFKTTLQEVQDADLLLHVVDVSHPNFRQLIEAVDVVLQELGAHEKPSIIVLNKIDQLQDRSEIVDLQKNFTSSVCVSALTGENIGELLEKISELLSDGMVEIDVKIPIGRMDLINLLHSQGQVHSIQYSSKYVHVVASVPIKLSGKLSAIEKIV